MHVASPKQIKVLMNVDCLTLLNVDMHKKLILVFMRFYAYCVIHCMLLVLCPG
jgi:hypothetical protein